MEAPLENSNWPELPLLRVNEVAEWLNLSRSAVYALMDKGALTYIKIGRSRRVHANDVRRLIERGRVGET